MDLTISNPVAGGFEYPHAQINQVFAALDHFSYHPEPFGELGARSAVSTYYAGRAGVTVSPHNIALTASTSEAYSVLFKLLCDPGDEILVPTPSYPLFDYLAALESVRTVPYRLLYAGNWFVDPGHLRSVLTKRTRAIVIVSPNNPTGSFLKSGEFSLLSDLAASHRISLICDEVFLDYPLSPAPDSMPTLAGNDVGLGFSLNGLSKSAGMPQLKLGWIVIHGEAAERARAAERLEEILDTYLSVGTPVQRALPGLLPLGLEFQKQIRARLHANMQAAVSLLEGSPVHPLHLEGGWSAILQLPGTRTEEFWATTLLRDYNVAVQPGYFFDMASEAFIVVSLLTPESEFVAGLQSLLQMVESIPG